MMITQTNRIMSAYRNVCKRGRRINESVEEDELLELDSDNFDDGDSTELEDETSFDEEDTFDDEGEEEVDVDDLLTDDDNIDIEESTKKRCGKKRCCNSKKGKKHCQCHSAYDTLGGQEVCESDEMPPKERLPMVADEILSKMDTTELDGHEVVTKLLDCLEQLPDMELGKILDCIDSTILGGKPMGMDDEEDSTELPIGDEDVEEHLDDL